jgi:hypothetical protein
MHLAIAVAVGTVIGAVVGALLYAMRIEFDPYPLLRQEIS